MALTSDPGCRKRGAGDVTACARAAKVRVLQVLIVVIACSLGGVAHAVDATWNYAVQVSARVSSGPPWSITLSWPEDTLATADYRPAYFVYRKAPESTSWGTPVTLSAGETSYIDGNVTEGVRYEYQIVRQFRDPNNPSANHDAYGYLIAGIRIPVVDQRGRVIVVVEDRVATGLADRVARFRADLVADGWTVTQLVVGAGDSPASVREQVGNAYFAGVRATALVLLGHIPVVRSGNTAPDGHERRALPADGYYGDVDGTWLDANGDGVFDTNTIPSDVELQTGRIDFAEMDAAGTGLDDLGLTARYLDKDHAFRTGALRFLARGLIGDRTGIDRGRAPAASGYRTFSALYGADNVAVASTEDDATDAERWATRLRTESYAWAFGSGGGDYDMATFLGTHGDYKSVVSSDLAGGAKAGFYLMFGSYFVDWANADNLLRAALAAPDGGLGAAWSGRPGFVFPGLGIGDAVGAGVRLTQNNNGFYFSPTNAFRRGVHVAWMGDPTLRIDYVAPPGGVTGARVESSVQLNWQPSPEEADGPIGYYVYRATSADGPFERVTSQPVDGATFTDTAAVSGGTYLVKAVALTTTGSGTYWNTSEGAAWTDTSAPVRSPATTGGGTVKLAIPLLFTPKLDAEQPGPK